MPKEIPETVRLLLREGYLGIAKRKPPEGVTRRENACLVIQRQFPKYFKDMLLEHVDDLLHMPSEQVVNHMVRRFTCPRCGHGKNLTVIPKGSDDDGRLLAGYDIYCTTPDTDSILFSKCWYHLGRNVKYGDDKWLRQK